MNITLVNTRGVAKETIIKIFSGLFYKSQILYHWIWGEKHVNTETRKHV